MNLSGTRGIVAMLNVLRSQILRRSIELLASATTVLADPPEAPASNPGHWRRLTWVLLGLVLSSCLRDLEGRPCPCQVGYTCCEGRCQSGVSCEENEVSAPVSTCGSQCTNVGDAAYGETPMDGSDVSVMAADATALGAPLSSNELDMASTDRDATLPDGETSTDGGEGGTSSDGPVAVRSEVAADDDAGQLVTHHR